MATSTTNLGLTKPAGTDKIRIAQINGNMDILDDKIGAVGNTSLQAQITSQNEAIANNEGAMAYIVGNTNTTGATLAVDQFVYVKGHSTIAEGLRKVTASISANGNITTSNTSACSEGGLNALNSVKLNRYGYTIPQSKGVKIGYDANTPVIISVQRPNAYARLILVGGGYGGEWIRNDFVELISCTVFTWCLLSGGGIDVMNSSGNDANLQVISPGSITFTEITALSGTADTSHAVALKSDVGDSSRIIKFTGTTQSTQSLSPSPNNYVYLMAILLASDGTTVVGTAFTTPEIAAAYTIKVYGESSSQWGSFKLSNDYSQGTFNRTSSNTESISLYGFVKK